MRRFVGIVVLLGLVGIGGFVIYKGLTTTDDGEVQDATPEAKFERIINIITNG